MKVVVTIALCTALVLLVSCVEDRSKWVDPHDMINFDHASGSMRNKKPSVPSEEGRAENVKDADSPAEPVAKSTAEKKLECPKCQCHCETCPTCPPQKECVCEQAALPLLRKYTQNLLTHLRDQMPGQKKEEFIMHVSLSGDQIEIFKKFVATGDRRHVHDVHDILARMVDRMAATRLGWLEKLAEKIEYKIGMTLDRLLQFVSLATLASVVLLIEVKLQIAWRRRVSQLIVLMFVISVPWTWYDLYKEAEIKQESKLSSVRPEDCEPGAGDGYMRAFKSMFTLQEDKCLQYYDGLMVNPLIKVPPTKAIAVTFVRFFVAPLKDVGMALSEFLRALLVDLPLTLYPIAMGMVCVFVFLLMVFWSGYRIRLPFYLLTMEPSEHYVAVAAGGNVQAVQQAVTEASQQTLIQLEQLREKLEGTQQQLSDKLQHLEKVQQLAIEYSQSFGPPSPAGSPTIPVRRAPADSSGDLPIIQSWEPPGNVVSLETMRSLETGAGNDSPIIQSQSEVVANNGSQPKPTNGTQSLNALTVGASVIKTDNDNTKPKNGSKSQLEAKGAIAGSEGGKKGADLVEGSGEGEGGGGESGLPAPGCVSLGGMVDTLLPDGVVEGRSST